MKSVKNALTDEEADLCRRVFAFERMEIPNEPDTIEAVENVLHGRPSQLSAWIESMQQNPPSDMNPRRHAAGYKKLLRGIQEDQKKLRGWLEEIERLGSLKRPGREEVAGIIERTLTASPHVTLPARGELRIEWELTFTGVEAHFAYAVGLLIDRDLGKRLHRCEHCQTFFIQQDARAKFCRPSHRVSHHHKIRGRK